jgi:hypothetical protein
VRPKSESLGSTCYQCDLDQPGLPISGLGSGNEVSPPTYEDERPGTTPHPQAEEGQVTLTVPSNRMNFNWARRPVPVESLPCSLGLGGSLGTFS